MALLDNPWVGVLSHPQGNVTSNIPAYFDGQGRKLSEASGGRITGVFAETRLVNDALSASYDVSAAAKIAAALASMPKPPELRLQDADEMYEEKEYCFEIRSDTYRFRLLTLRFGPLYPVTMRVDDGVFRDLSGSSGRFSLTKDGHPRQLSIKDDEDLDAVFRMLLGSRKLNYICNRLMAEADKDVAEA